MARDSQFAKMRKKPKFKIRVRNRCRKAHPVVIGNGPVVGGHVFGIFHLAAHLLPQGGRNHVEGRLAVLLDHLYFVHL